MRVILGTWVPALNIFETSMRRGKFDENRKLSDGSMLEFAKVYGLDAVYDTPEDVPEDVATNKRYAAAPNFTVSEVAEQVKEDFGSIDIVVHSLANGPEVQKPLWKPRATATRALRVLLLQGVAPAALGPIMNKGGAAISTYLASEKIIPGYGGDMGSARPRSSPTRGSSRTRRAASGASASTPPGSLGSRAARPSASSTT